MTSGETPATKNADHSQPTAAGNPWLAADALLERCGDRLNPILVKESRQALKSKQFLITFTLLLVFGWAWSLGGIALSMPGIYFMPSGSYMLIGYFLVLVLPMLTVAPFSAYRSLAVECEDGSFELLSITTLSSRQIVMGKLGSAILQMVIYYSALSPCIAFTYLLRGVDILTIGLVLFYTFLASIILSAIGLMLAGLTRSRALQILLSVVFIAALLIVSFIWSYSFIALIALSSSISFDSSDFWVSQLVIISFYCSYLALIIIAGGGLISFASDNRSTKLRWGVLVQHLLLVGWLAYFWARYTEVGILFVFVTIASMHWFAVGVLMVGETAQLSPRGRRDLPQSFLGRMMLGWFNPGSGTGYVFVTLNLFSIILVSWCIALFAYEITGVNPRRIDSNFYPYSLLLAGYVAIYLGLGRLILLMMRRFFRAGIFTSILIHLVLGTVVGIAIPLLFQFVVSGYAVFDYSELQVSNWAWTLAVAADSNNLPDSVPYIIVISGGVLFMINLVLAAKEVDQVRQAAPMRVLKDEREQHLEKHPSKPQPKSPWDEQPETEAAAES